MLQELRVEEEKTQQKTLALEAEVRRLKAELWTGSFGSRGLSPSRSEAPMVQESSVKPRSRLEVVKEDGKQKGVDTELDSAVTALRSSVLGVMDDALLKVGELFQSDSRPAPAPAPAPVAADRSGEPSTGPSGPNSEDSYVAALSDLWKASGPRSAAVAFTEFGALLQQQARHGEVTSAAEVASSALPSTR
ncbi:unnamed protein product [Effrenium voratum]|nr:unnamed protein product [Effrenium voratum]